MILGIDPAIASIGYAVFDPTRTIPRDQVIDYGTITTSSKDLLGSRLASVRKDIIELAKHYRPDKVAIEKCFFMGHNTNAHLVQFALGVIVLALHEAGAQDIVWVNTAQAKTAVGCKGNAGKLEVKAAVLQQFGLDKKGADDGFDAVAIAYAALIGNVIQEKAA